VGQVTTTEWGSLYHTMGKFLLSILSAMFQHAGSHPYRVNPLHLQAPGLGIQCRILANHSKCWLSLKSGTKLFKNAGIISFCNNEIFLILDELI
jgi:hypothetical protein